MHLFERDQKTQHVRGWQGWEWWEAGGVEAELHSDVRAVKSGPCHFQCQLAVAHPPTK